MKLISVCLLVISGALPVLAQRDFLTTDEVERVREAQEPNDRLKLYVLFARQRMDQLQQLLSKDKKGRTAEVRQLLSDYSSIIDAIDTVSDDALKRHVAIVEGAAAVAAAEKRFLGQLQKISDSPPADAGLYDISLKDAMAATSDSMDLAGNDPSKRAAELVADEQKEKKAVKTITRAEDSLGKTPDEIAADRKQEAKAEAEVAGKPKRKPPTLYRPGEKPPDPQ
ncbi:MAG TPA: hypothetical protein VG273_07035 [Bryobacteraceae bacterium]|jgi:isoaspartyl peptidase/L-asparaginase-like protein (Ntn-hydrolase superfamily)|nr:hypothetical protein [Bryobacteraceae bacterium]